MTTSSLAALVWDDVMASYDFGASHPLNPVRVELTVELIRQLGMIGGSAYETTPGAFDEAELLRLHRPDFVKAVRRVSADPAIRNDWAHGLGPGDNPIFGGMHEASMLVCAASKEAARIVWEGEAKRAFNPAGGLHHAMPDRAAGFCIYNDPAVAIDWLLEHGAERVCYLDVDVHHGDGVQEMFWNDPRVLTISLHESGRYLFPGTGFPDEVGGAGAAGSAANVPFHPGTNGPTWLATFDQVIDPLVRAFAPDIIVSQLGCDTHATDPLAHLAFRIDDFRMVLVRIRQLADQAADGRWVGLGGGGYQLVQVVPRAWTVAFAEMSEVSLPDETPPSWRQLALDRAGELGPTHFSDGDVEVPEHIAKQAEVAALEAAEAVRTLVLSHHA